MSRLTETMIVVPKKAGHVSSPVGRDEVVVAMFITNHCTVQSRRRICLNAAFVALLFIYRFEHDVALCPYRTITLRKNSEPDYKQTSGTTQLCKPPTIPSKAGFLTRFYRKGSYGEPRVKGEKQDNIY